MIDKQKIERIVTQLTEGTDLFLVEVKSSVMNEVEVTIDGDNGVGIDRCIEISRAIEAEFDRDTEDFELTVISAGIGQPIRLLRQYRKVIGKIVEVVLKNGRKLVGTLEEADEEKIVLSWQEKQLVEGKKRKQLVDVVQEIPLKETHSTRLQIKF